MLVNSISRTGVPSWGQRMILAQRPASHANSPREACLAAGSASHPSVTLETYIGNMIYSSARVDEGYGCLYEHHSSRYFCSKHIARASFNTPFSHSEPPGQGMARARGSCPGRVASISAPSSAPTSFHASAYLRGPSGK